MKKTIGKILILTLILGAFPLGGREGFYKKSALEAQQKGAKTKVYCAEKQGDMFFYQQGKIK
jgi:hypothetical protein